MKSNGALKPRQGASRQGSSPGVVLKKYRDKRYCKLNKNVAYGGLSLYNCGPSYTGQKQYIVKKSKNNENINRQKQTQSQQTHIQKQQETVCDISNNSNNSINKLSRKTKSLKIQNKPTDYKITTITQTIITVTKKSFCFIDFNSNRREYSDKKAAILERRNKNNNNITTRQVENNKNDKNHYNKHNTNANSKSCKKQNEKRKERKQAEEVQVVKTTKQFLKHQVNVNKANNNNNNNKNNICDLIYFMKQQQQQQQQQLVVNKFLSIVKIYENLVLCALIFSAAIISRLLKQLKLLIFFMYSHAIKHLNGGYPIDRSSRDGIGNHKKQSAYTSAVSGGKSFVVTHGFRLAKIMRASQSLKEPFETTSSKNVNKSHLKPTIALWIVVCVAVTILLPQPAVGDDGDNFFPINSIETTTPEFDYASRGQKKFGDKCDNTLECGFPGSICDPKKKSCQCTEDLPVTNHIDKCGKEAAVNESCFFNEQCEVKYFQTECRDQRCVCRFDMTPVWLKDGTVECKGRGDKKGPETYIDPAMIGVLIGMALMFIIICVVLRLFSQARWRENRTIFNTPNPRLMNVSLLRESKLLHGQERRGSRMSVRVPSRQPSMASLRPHSPNPSLGKTGSRSNSHGSNASATSLRSTRSNSVSPAGITVNNTHHDRKGSTYQPHHHSSQQATHLQQQEQQPLTQTNIISNPVAETVTVEIIEPEK